MLSKHKMWEKFLLNHPNIWGSFAKWHEKRPRRNRRGPNGDYTVG